MLELYISVFSMFSLFFSVNITFIDKQGNRHPIRGKVGDNVLYLAHRYEVELEGSKHKDKKLIHVYDVLK